ncbi:MAG: NAD-dependent epimerase [Mucilaginibacter sp.]|jgi:UDP-glucuronate 4-epimerase|uniref:NAD-dependent epimerase n=1 Tax=Mucilaginibacter sp. TaxID=1882438 RepID=UPI0035634110
MKILVTGTAGFIGFHVAQRLLERGDTVVGIDNLNDYYDVRLKYARLAQTGIDVKNVVYGQPVQSTLYAKYSFLKLDLIDKDKLVECFAANQFDAVCNLAAQAGVRYSLTNPDVYIDSNVKGFLNILECCRHFKINHLAYASSSSVYGLNKNMPFRESGAADHPVSLYAASKKANEMMAHTYSHLFGLRTTGLRFFTVYGPWGRPDMALFIFTKAIIEGTPVELFNNGNMRRDFTYIDDIVEGIVHVIDNPAASNQAWNPQKPDPCTSSAPFRLFNIGRGAPVNLVEFVDEIEHKLNIKAIRKYKPMQDGDVSETWADVSALDESVDYSPRVSVPMGISYFISWYKSFYGPMANNLTFEKAVTNA